MIGYIHKKGNFLTPRAFYGFLFPPDERHSIPYHCSFLAPFSHPHFHFGAPRNVGLKKQ